MESTQAFATKLNLVLKALTMSRGRAAAEAGVDKSLMSRWASGAVMPSAHNLANLTAMVARRKPGFTLLDWDRDLDGLAEVFGVDVPALPADTGSARPAAGLPDLPFGVLSRARAETERRAAVYEGHYRGARPAMTRPGMVLRDHVMIRRGEHGLFIRMVGGGWEVAGWGVLAQGQVYAVLGDVGDDGLAFLLLNGTTLPRAVVLDGLFTSVALDRGRSIGATPVVLRRIADLAADPAEDDARVEAAKAAPFMDDAATLEPGLRAYLFPEVGPAAHAAGGELILRLPWDRALAQGETLDPA